MLLLLLACSGLPDTKTSADPAADPADDADTATTADTGATTAREACNGVDDDGDGRVDEASADGCTRYYADDDGDGVGGDSSACLCAADGVYSATATGDCDDADPTVIACPGVTESPGARIYASGSSIWPTGGHTDARIATSGSLGGNTWTLATNGGVYAVPAEGDVPAGEAAIATVDGVLLTVADLDGDGVDDMFAMRSVAVTYDGGVNYAEHGRGLVFRGPLAGAYGEADATLTIEGTVEEYGGCCALDAAAPGDVDGDGTRDLLVWDGTIARVPLDGSAPVQVLDGGIPRAVGDLDGDGLDDLGVIASDTVAVFALPLTGPVTMDDADATIRFEPGEIDVGPAGDLDGDGLGDLRIDQSSIYVVPALASGPVADVATVTLTDFHRALAGDIDGDGRDDLVAGSPEGRAAGFAGPLAGTYAVTDAVWSADESLKSARIGSALATLPGDGAPWALAVAAPYSDLGGVQGGEVDFFSGW